MEDEISENFGCSFLSFVVYLKSVILWVELVCTKFHYCVLDPCNNEIKG